MTPPGCSAVSGARVEAACPDFSEVTDIVRGTRAVAMVALHADKLPKWREQMQKDLVQDIEQGLALTAREIAHGEVLRSVLWHRVRAFMATRDLLVLPTVAVPPFPVEEPTRRRSTASHWTATSSGSISRTDHPDRPAGDLGALRLHARRVTRRPADRRPPPSGGRRPPGRRRLRGGRALGRRLPPVVTALAAERSVPGRADRRPIARPG